MDFVKISFNALDVGEFAIVKLFILADAGAGIVAHTIYIKVAAADVNGNPDEIITIMQGDEALNMMGSGTEGDPYVIATDDYGTGLEATVFIEGSFNTVEFEADVPSDTNYKVSSVEGIDTTAGVDIDTTFTVEASDADGDTVGDTFDVTFDSGVEIVGTDGADVIVGNGGDQTVIGGLGDDTLTGATGGDTFVFSLSTNEGTDTIVDFSVSDGDVLHFTDVVDGPDGGIDIGIDDAVASFADGGGVGMVDTVVLTSGTTILITDLNGTLMDETLAANSLIN
jgi:Ca2+-binding RTX toxin-like protein